MCNNRSVTIASRIAACLALALINALPFSAFAQHARSAGSQTSDPGVAVASDDGRLAIKRFSVPPGFKVDLWAAEPLLANPVAFTFDEHGRAYICETFRLGAGVDDIRGIMSWLDEELASRTVDDRLAEMKRHLGDRFPRYSEKSERIRLLEDRGGTGKADHATVFADGFNSPLDGIGAGVLARGGKVWYANIPNLWQLQDTDGDGVADQRKSLHYGFGVRVGFLGHDLHGLRFGPDGRIYFSIGDRGSNVRVAEGRWVGEPDTGCVFRCNPDGSDLEVFATGLRNPQDLVFDEHGNLFTGDNNSDSGDEARWVYLVEGGDSGWRVGFQFMENPYSRGAFNAEKLWYPPFTGQAANIVPPVANIASGPSGITYNPGTGLPERYREHFFLTDFRGGAANSGVHTFTLKPKGAGFELSDAEHFIWGILTTDSKFGVDGGLYVSDWVQGWGLTGKGRIYRVHAPELDQDATILQTRQLLAHGFESRSLEELGKLLSHLDMRVRQEAQFALAAHPTEAFSTLSQVAKSSSNPLARLHAIWGLGQIASSLKPGSAQGADLDLLVQLLSDHDAEVRAQSAKVLGERHFAKAFVSLSRALTDPAPRVRFFAALSLGKLGEAEAIPAIRQMLTENEDADPYLRHAGVMALTWIGDMNALLTLAQDKSASVRMGALLAMRRLQRPEIAAFLHDSDPRLVLEAARAINDAPINGASQDLAELLGTQQLEAYLSGDPFLRQLQGGKHEGHPRSETGLDALLRRVLNANFHVGTTKTAEALAAFAARSDGAPAMRIEALHDLGDWAHPSGIDRVVGLWRPIAAVRQADIAAEALEPRLSAILQTAPDEVKTALFRAAGQLKMRRAAPQLECTLNDKTAGSSARVAALQAIADLDLQSLETALNTARSDPSEELRKAATRLEGKVNSSDPVQRLSKILGKGTVNEQQVAFATLGAISGSSADRLITQWLDRLRQGQVAPALQLDLLEAAAKRNAPEVKKQLDRYEAARASSDPLAGFQETLFGGSVPEGRKVFFERAEAQCVRCHRVGGEGGDVGPDLTHVAAQKDRRYLLESIVYPNKQIAPGFESVTITLKDGDSVGGVLKSESPSEVVVNTPDNGLVHVRKTDIQSRAAALSPMPEGLGQVLSKEDIRNLVEFLAAQK